jgi:serpin B
METTIPFKASGSRWWRLILSGVLFEIALVVIVCLLPETWLASEIRNATIVVHLPLLIVLASAPDVLGLVLLPFALFAMGLFWALVFYWILRLKTRLWTSVSSRHEVALKCVFCLVVLLALVLTVLGLLPANPRPFAISPEIRSVVEANNAFAIDLYQKLRDNRGNLFFSPYSISSVLAMTCAGAGGQTKSEMVKALHFDSEGVAVPVAFKKLTDRIREVQRWNRITLMSANSIWCQQNHPLAAKFLSSVRENYNGDAKSVSFINAPEAAQNEINSWVSQKTGGKIQNLIEPGKLSDSTRMVLCNAIYFKGKWQTQFKASETRRAPFYVSTNRIVNVPMMRQEARFKIMRSDDMTVSLIELPYIGSDLSMVIILPVTEPEFDSEHVIPLSDVEGNLTSQTLRSWLAELDQCNAYKAIVSIPRFKTGQDFDLSGCLKALGMASAFDKDKANFSGMDETTNLYVSDVFHRAFVEVNESGTEAAAASLVFVKTRSMPERFIANHPFIFLIRDNATGSILFLGRIVDPTE